MKTTAGGSLTSGFCEIWLSQGPESTRAVHLQLLGQDGIFSANPVLSLPVQASESLSMACYGNPVNASTSTQAIASGYFVPVSP